MIRSGCALPGERNRKPLPQVNAVSGAIDRLTAAQRLAEVAEILAAGLLRLRARELGSHRGDGEQVRLDYSPGRSVHADRLRPRRTAR